MFATAVKTATLALLSNPITLILVGIAAAVTAVYAFVQANKELESSIKDVGDSIKNQFSRDEVKKLNDDLIDVQNTTENLRGAKAGGFLASLAGFAVGGIIGGIIGFAATLDNVAEAAARQDDAIKRSKDELVLLGISAGESKGAMEDFSRDLDLTSKEGLESYKTKLGEISDKIKEIVGVATGQFGQLTQGWEQNASIMKDGFQAWKKSFEDNQFKITGSKEAADKITSEVIDTLIKGAAQAGDVGKSFAIMFEQGISASDARDKLAQSGFAVGQEVLVAMARKSADAGETGKALTILYGAGVISESQRAAALGGEVTKETLQAMINTNVANAEKVKKSAVNVISGSGQGMVKAQATASKTINMNAFKTGSGMVVSIGNGMASEKGTLEKIGEKISSWFRNLWATLSGKAKTTGQNLSGVEGLFSNTDMSGIQIGASGVDELATSIDGLDIAAIENASNTFADLNKNTENLGGGGGGGGGVEAKDMPAWKYAEMMSRANEMLQSSLEKSKQSISLNDENIKKLDSNGKLITDNLQNLALSFQGLDFEIPKLNMTGFTDAAKTTFEGLAKNVNDSGKSLKEMALKFSDLKGSTLTIEDLSKFTTDLGKAVVESAKSVDFLEKAFNSLYAKAKDTISGLKDEVTALKKSLEDQSDTIDYEIKLEQKRADIVDAQSALEKARADAQKSASGNALKAQEALLNAQDKLNQLTAEADSAAVMDSANKGLLKAQQALLAGEKKLVDLKNAGADPKIVTLQENAIAKLKQRVSIAQQIRDETSADLSKQQLAIDIAREEVKTAQEQANLASQIRGDTSKDERVQQAQERLTALEKEQKQLELIRAIETGQAQTAGGQLVNPADLATLKEMDNVMQLQVQKAILLKEQNEKISEAEKKSAAFEALANAIKEGQVSVSSGQVTAADGVASATADQVAELQSQLDLFKNSTDAQDQKYFNQLRDLSQSQIQFQVEKAQQAELMALQKQFQDNFKLFSDEEKTIKQTQLDADKKGVDDMMYAYGNMSETQKRQIDEVKNANTVAINETIANLERQRVAADSATRAWLAAFQAQQQANAGKTGFAGGGYTGRGSMFDIAGVVHKNEYVIPSKVLSRLAPTGLLGLLEKMRVGFSGGGYTSQAPAGATTNNVVNLDVKQSISDSADMKSAGEMLYYLFRQRLAS